MEIDKCPKCNEKGSITGKWVRSSYYPQSAALALFELEKVLKALKRDPNNIKLLELEKHILKESRGRVRGKKYRGDINIKTLKDNEKLTDEDKNKEIYFRVSSKRKYPHVYVRHYDKELYKQQKMKYEKGERKTKPDGKKWCYIKDEQLRKMGYGIVVTPRRNKLL